MRSLAMGLALCLLASSVMMATDDTPTIRGAMPGRLCALAPFLAALGALLANAQASMRGETRALACVGVHPVRIALGSASSVVVLGIIGAFGLWFEWGDVDGLLPRVEGVSWVPLSGGGWGSSDGAVVLGADGVLSVQRVAAAEQVQRSAGPVVACVGWMALVLADWTTEPMHPWARLLAVVLGAVVGVVLFHALAAELVSAWVLLAIPLPPWVQTWGLRAVRWGREAQREGQRG